MICIDVVYTVVAALEHTLSEVGPFARACVMGVNKMNVLINQEIFLGYFSFRIFSIKFQNILWTFKIHLTAGDKIITTFLGKLSARPHVRKQSVFFSLFLGLVSRIFASIRIH